MEYVHILTGEIVEIEEMNAEKVDYRKRYPNRLFKKIYGGDDNRPSKGGKRVLEIDESQPPIYYISKPHDNFMNMYKPYGSAK